MKHSTAFRLAGCILLMGYLSGCGLVYDAVQRVVPSSTDELDDICRHQRVRIGMAVEPFRPFVFPAIWTDEGVRITGLDVEIVKHVIAALSRHCEAPVTPTLHLVRFRDLFTLLSEGHIDLFISAVTANTPAFARAGFAYSTPYFYEAGISGITVRKEIVERVKASFQAQATKPPHDGLDANQQSLAGLTIAVQKWTAAHWYAEANLKANRLILCDSLPAAFEAFEASSDPPIDVILGDEPILKYMATYVHTKWLLLTTHTERPFFLTRAHYSIVMAEDSYQLRWFIDNLLFKLEESNALTTLRTRWVEELYAYPRRASAEGLPFDIDKMVAHYDQGSCKAAPPR
jgi:polar amino acid transport system substrate-binding protein